MSLRFHLPFFLLCNGGNRVSDFFYLGPSLFVFYEMLKIRFEKESLTVTRFFFYKKYLRHGFLHTNVFNIS